MRQQILDLINQRVFTDEEVLALGPESVPALIALFDEIVSDEMGTQRQTIVHMLGLLDGDQGVEFLKVLYHQLTGEDETLQMSVLSALARTDHVAALALVLPLLETGEKRARKNAIVGLRHTRRPEVLDKVKKSARSDPDPSLRRYSERVAAEIEEHMHKD
jgi:HEAT repeat protein